MDARDCTVNSARGHVAFQAGGRDYTLALTTNAMVRYQDAADETLLRGLNELQKDPSDIRRIRRLIWAGLSHHDGITEDMAGDLMDDIGVMDSVLLLSEASRLAFPDAGDAGNARKPAAKKAPATKTM